MSSTTTDRRLGLTGSAAIKVPCKAATTANITLSGTQTVDGVSVTTGDRVLVKSQTSSVNNGIYVVDTGTWTRDLDFDGVADAVTGTIVMVLNGSANANTYWRLATTGTVTFGTSAITFAAALAGDAAMVTFLPSGTGAVASDLQTWNRQFISVFGFMTAAQIADVQAGTLAVDVSTAVQNFLNAVAAGKRGYMPAGRYKIGTGLALTNNNSGGIVYGDSSGASGVGLGTSLEFTIASGAAFTLTGVNSPFPLELQNITLKGNADADAGLQIFSSSNVRLNHVTIRDFTKNPSNALYLTTTIGTDFTGVFTAEECMFSNNYRDAYNDSALTTTLTFDRCQFSGGTYGLVNGTTSIATAIRTANFRDCLFETKGNTEIYSGGGAQSWNIDSCYFEWTAARTPIIFDGSVNSPISDNICVTGCTFAGIPADANGLVNITATMDGFRFENNYGASTNHTASKYGVYHSSGTLTNYYIERVGVASGNTYPGTCRVNSTNYSSTQVKVQDNITFNGALTAASGAAATSQLLNAYEEGTWTPVLQGSSGTFAHTYSTQLGTYTRVGRIVHFTCYIQLSAKDAGMTGNALIVGLPFSTADNAAVSIGLEQNVTLSATYNWHSGYTQGGGNFYINLIEIKTAAAFQALPSANIAATSGFIVSGSYRT